MHDLIKHMTTAFLSKDPKIDERGLIQVNTNAKCIAEMIQHSTRISFEFVCADNKAHSRWFPKCESM